MNKIIFIPNKLEHSLFFLDIVNSSHLEISIFTPSTKPWSTLVYIVVNTV